VRLVLGSILASWIVTLAGCASGIRPHDVSSPRVVRLPFTLTAANNIAVRATLNDVDAVNLMFHTAVDSVSLTRETIERLSHFEVADSVDVKSWGGTASARRSTGNTLRMGELAWRDLTIFETEQSGPATDGKFGPNLFAGRIVEVDYDAGEISIHAVLPPIGTEFQRLDLARRNGACYVTCPMIVAGEIHATEFMLHTGFGGTALLDQTFLREHGLDAKLAVVGESTLRDSFGNPVPTRTVRIPSLRLGPQEFVDVAVGTFDGRIGSDRASVLGAGLLARCHWILDPDHGHLYVAPRRTEIAARGS